MSVVIETTIGDITIDLFLDERPRTCMNFMKLCKMKYYNYNLIFSIQRNFVAQTGDPTGSGKGGNSIFQITHGEEARYYEGEKIPIIKHKNMGTISMASCGSGMYGSQFFITLGNDLDSLDEEHLVFGQTVEGFEILEKLNQTLIDETKRPYQDILITHTILLSDPFPDPESFDMPSRSPEPPRALFNSNYIAADEELENDDLKNLVQIQEEIEMKEAEARATILEMVGDLPSADMAPPENVLFVCKLNPVTTSEDLEVIFSRFGKINSAEVIHDRVTGSSLQYAFIEFTNQKSCEDAYFKMDNVLIDDRRVHVDFSQSVSKIQWKGKGRGVDYFDDKGRKVDKEFHKPGFNFGKKSGGTDKPPPRRFPVDNSHWRDPLYKHKHSEPPRRSDAPVRPHRDYRKEDSETSSSSSEEEEEKLKLKSKKERKKIMKKLRKELKKRKKKRSSKKKSKSKKRKKHSSSSSSDESSSSSN